jgi:hypothetical protein
MRQGLTRLTERHSTQDIGTNYARKSLIFWWGNISIKSTLRSGGNLEKLSNGIEKNLSTRSQAIRRLIEIALTSRSKRQSDRGEK